MGYIRTNEDYYISEGMSLDNARLHVELDRLGADTIDYGVCNPIKSKLAAEAEEDLRERARER